MFCSELIVVSTVKKTVEELPTEKIVIFLGSTTPPVFTTRVWFPSGSVKFLE